MTEAEGIVRALLGEGAYQANLDKIMGMRRRLDNLKWAKRVNKQIDDVDKPDKRKRRLNLH